MTDLFKTPAWAPTQALAHRQAKPTVRYIGPAQPRAPDRACLIPLNHPSHVPGQHIINGRPLITSRIVEWDRASGRIETLNTRYWPAEDGNGADEMLAKTGLPAGVAA